MMKICVDPYFKPKKVDDPNRENLFELIYSPGKTMNSKEKVNQRREYTWNDLYPEQTQVDEFLKERLITHKSRLLKIKGIKQRNRTPSKKQDAFDIKPNTSREELKGVKVVTNDNLQLVPVYSAGIENSFMILL